MTEHEKHMKECLRLARKGLGRASPNPMVGAVVVRDGRVVGRGWHRRPGTPHAEIHALREAGEAARGATVYVSLEPCNHHGRTGPCSEALIEAGAAEVIAGMGDPNPQAAGGAERLRRAGVRVVVGVLEEECRRLNEAFVKVCRTGLPFVVMKGAASLDGRIAAVGGDSKWISSEASRRHAHRLRGALDAVLVGAGTVLADDPSLTCRVGGGFPQPVPVVLDSKLRTPPGARLLESPARLKIIAGLAGAPKKRRAALEAAGATVLALGADAAGRPDARELLEKLPPLGVSSVLAEGGGEIHASLLAAGLVDKVVIYYAPLLLGGREAPPLVGGRGVPLVSAGVRLGDVRVRRLGGDVVVEGYVVR